MASRAEHYRKAETLLEELDETLEKLQDKSIPLTPNEALRINSAVTETLQRAQVHATLASVSFPTVSETEPTVVRR